MHVEQEWQDGNTANAYTFVVALASDIVNIFLLCYIGEYIIDTVSSLCVFIKFYHVNFSLY